MPGLQRHEHLKRPLEDPSRGMSPVRRPLFIFLRLRSMARANRSSLGRTGGRPRRCRPAAPRTSKIFGTVRGPTAKRHSPFSPALPLRVNPRRPSLYSPASCRSSANEVPLSDSYSGVTDPSVRFCRRFAPMLAGRSNCARSQIAIKWLRSAARARL